MEAKVDVRKLQLLNDRIIQTLEALNQVRASVHGIGHAPYGVSGPMSQPWAPGLGHTPAIQSGYYGSVPFASYPQYGLSHTSGYPFGPQLMSPMAAWQPYPQQPWQQPYAAQAPWYPMSPIGLSHSGIEETERRVAEQRASDPGRLMQTFPFGAYV